MSDFLMPKLGADMTAGTLVAWHKKAGDVVRRGDIVAEVETEKGNIDVEIFANGVVEEIVVPVGQQVPVGTVLARIRDGVEPEIVMPAGPPTGAVPMPAATALNGPAETGARAQRLSPAISPSARRLARELGVDPAAIQGTGPHHAITREDIQRAAAGRAAPGVPAVAVSPAPGATPEANQRAARMRQAIAASMARSKREIPHYYLSTTIDMQPAIDWLTEENTRRPLPERLLPGVLLLKAVALALREVPELNALWDGDRTVRHDEIHVGAAISLREGGLVAPAIHNTDRKSLGELMQAFRDLVKRARSGGLRSSELGDPTITVTSLGDQGVETVYGVIYPPQVAMVGFGALVTRPWVVKGGLFVRQVITATLSGDHRVSDGHRGGVFLNAIARLLQEPEKL